jgi:hypothetical protein
LFRAYHRDIRAYQATKGTNFSYDTLVDLFGSIERFIRRLDIYIQVPCAATLDERMIEIMIELLYTLGLATKRLKQGQSSKCILTDMLPSLSGIQ